MGRGKRTRIAAGAGIGTLATLGAGGSAQAADFTVVNLSDGTGTGPVGSLRRAITDANAAPGADTVLFDATLTGSVVLSSTSIPITEALTIDGPGADVLGVDGYLGSGRIFTVDPLISGDPVTISGLTLAYGQTTGSGGAIFNTDAKLTVSGAHLVANSSTNAGIGAGALADAGAYAGGTQTRIENSTISGNAALNGSGGGVGTGGQLGEWVNSTVYYNYAKVDGGGLNANLDGGTFQNTTVAYNVAAENGGGIAVFNGAPTVAFQNSIVGRNFAGGVGEDLLGFGGTHIDVEFSLISDPGSTTINSTVTGSNLIGTTPELGFLADNGGTTPTILPLFDSPVVDQGKAAGGVTIDQRGGPRPFDVPDVTNSAAIGSDGSDMGAAELTADEATAVDLALSVLDSPDPVTEGDQVTYTVTVENNGNEDATGVETETFLDGPQVFSVAGTSPGCTPVGGPFGTSVVCDFDGVLSGTSKTRTIVANNVGRPYMATYSEADADQADAHGYDNFAYSYTDVVPRPATGPDGSPGSFGFIRLTPSFDLAGAIKKCRKKFRGKKRKKCIKKARKQAAASATKAAELGIHRRHAFVLRERPPGLGRRPTLGLRRGR